ncbi:hypothetical protein T484DRAFT_1795661, partial [Baffinella frigidus]
MSPSTPNHALRNNAHLLPSRPSVVCDLRGDATALWGTESSPSTRLSSRSSWPSRAGAPSPSACTSSPKPAASPNPSSVKTPTKLRSLQSRRSKTDATQHHFPFADQNEEDSIIDELSLAGTPTVQRNTNVVTDANFKAHRHRRGGCLAHPSGCDCEKVQRPTMGQNEAWQVMSLRFKAVHTPTLCTPSAAAKPKLERRESDPLPRRVNGATLLAPVSTGTNAPLKPRESDPVPRHAPRVDDLRERSIEKVLSRLPARSTGPAVFAVPSRVAQRLKPVGHDSRAGAA